MWTVRPVALAGCVAALLLASAMPSAHAAEADASEHERSRQFQETIALASSRLDREPDYVPARLVRALAYYRTGQPAEALADLDDVLARVPDDSGARTLRALVGLELGRYTEALQDARGALEASELPPENAGAAHLVVARVLLAQRRYADATSHLQAVTALPDATNARAAQLTLELLRALPPPGLAPRVEPASDGFQRFTLGEWLVEFQSDDGIALTTALSLARLLEAQMAAITTTTGVAYRGPLRLVIYKSEWDLEQHVGGHYRGPGRGRALRQGVRTPGGGWTQHVHVALTNYELLWNLTHEAVHLAQAAAGLDDAFPRTIAWLVEGHAEQVTETVLRDMAPFSTAFRRRQRGSVVAEAAEQGRLLSLRELEQFRDWDRVEPDTVALAYGQAYYAAARFVERFGAAAVFTLLRAQQAGATAAEAFRTATGGRALSDFDIDLQSQLRGWAAEDASSVE